MKNLDDLNMKELSEEEAQNLNGGDVFVVQSGTTESTHTFASDVVKSDTVDPTHTLA